MTRTIIELYRVHQTAPPSSVKQMDSIPTRRKGRKAERPQCAVRERVVAAGALPTPIDLGDRDDSGQNGGDAPSGAMGEDVTADRPLKRSLTARGMSACALYLDRRIGEVDIHL